MILIGDPRVSCIEINECNERLVDIKVATEELLIDTSRKDVQKASLSISHLRESVISRLVLAQQLLPSKYRLFIKECYRPLSVQKQLFDYCIADLRTKRPEFSEGDACAEASKYVAPPSGVPPHSTGGAVDLTLWTNDGELDLGTPVNASPWETRGATYTYPARPITGASDRQLLVEVMTSCGFVNYPSEWWHWSYGDQYWAFIRGEPYAIYGTVPEADACY